MVHRQRLLSRRYYALTFCLIITPLLCACNQGPGEKPFPPPTPPQAQTPPQVEPPSPARTGTPKEEVLKAVKDRSGRHTAQVVQRGDKQVVIRDGQSGLEYDQVGEVAFSADGNSLAYEAKQGEAHLLVLDGREWPLNAEVVQGSLKVSPDNLRLALAARAGGKWQVMVNGRPDPPFDFVFTETLKFSPDGKHFGYLALKEEKLQVVVDGQVKRQLEVLTEGKEALADTLSLYEDAKEEKAGEGKKE